MLHTTKNFSERQHYVHHSSKLISCSTKGPLILKFYTVEIQAPCLLEICHPSQSEALEVIVNKTAVLHAFEHWYYAGFQTLCPQRFTGVLCTEVVIFMEDNIQLARRSPKMYRSTAKPISFKIILWQYINYPKVFDSLEFLT